MSSCNLRVQSLLDMGKAFGNRLPYIKPTDSETITNAQGCSVLLPESFRWETPPPQRTTRGGTRGRRPSHLLVPGGGRG